MLMVTENAGQAIESIVANAEVPDGSGLRIDAPDEPPAPDGSGIALQLQVASQPAEQDQVVSEGGAKVFIAPARPGCATTRCSTSRSVRTGSSS
jgi:Fe-S cluster assembly iron-binding protein IscA